MIIPQGYPLWLRRQMRDILVIAWEFNGAVVMESSPLPGAVVAILVTGETVDVTLARANQWAFLTEDQRRTAG